MAFPFRVFRVFCVVMVLALLTVFSACGSDGGTSLPPVAVPGTGPTDPSPPPEPTPAVVTGPGGSPGAPTAPAPTSASVELPVAGVTLVPKPVTEVPAPTLVTGTAEVFSTPVLVSTPVSPRPSVSEDRAGPDLGKGDSDWARSAELAAVGVTSADSSGGGGRGGPGRHPDRPHWPHRPDVQAGALTAGEVDDNRLWDEYLRYLDGEFFFNFHEVDVSERYRIRVTDNSGRPTANARVVVSGDDGDLWEGVTYADGETYFYPLPLSPQAGPGFYNVEVELDGQIAFAKFAGGSDGVNVVLGERRSWYEGVPLDVLFLVDSTGSMDDEITRIKETLVSISGRIDALPSRPDLRFGMVVYRDRGDEYVTRTFSFIRGARQFMRDVRRVSAEGGGDYPESLNEALHVAVREMDWRLGVGARLVFMFADAPPHLDYPQDYDYSEEMRVAHQLGIKIYPIASSGLDPQGEYIFRQIAQQTKGRFLFLLYGGDTPHSVEQYTVNNLDDLVVGLVEEEMAHFGAPSVYRPR